MSDQQENNIAKSSSLPTDACVNCSDCSCGNTGCGSRCNLHSYNYLADVPGNDGDSDIVEVHFKNTRRGFYRNTNHLSLQEGDWVAVEANPGHDIGQVSLTGRLARLQMKRIVHRADAETLRVFRKARAIDMERYEEAKAREQDTMIRSRQIAKDLGLKMKIGDVEYQGDGNKAIFYYIADERVDFRQLIKVLADVFKIRVEMKQIGARQEAGRIGGIGPCGRPLCCASWMSNFVSVSTGAARFQDISLNPQKLAGQCAKLKCCINFEVDTYVEASKKMPPKDVILETKDALYYHFKTDLIKREMTYSTERNSPVGAITITADRVREIIALNRAGEKPDSLLPDGALREKEVKAFGDILGQDSISRFDKKKKKKKKSSGKAKRDHQEPQSEGEKPRPERRQPQESQAGGERKPQPSQGGEKRRPEGQRNRSARRQEPKGDGQQQPRDNRQGQPRDNRRQKPRDNRQRPRRSEGNEKQPQGNKEQ